jgi:hypothetical protein
LRSEPVPRAVYRMTPHNWLNFLRCHRRASAKFRNVGFIGL